MYLALLIVYPRVSGVESGVAVLYGPKSGPFQDALINAAQLSNRRQLVGLVVPTWGVEMELQAVVWGKLDPCLTSAEEESTLKLQEL